MKFYKIIYGDCEGFKARQNIQTVEWATTKKEAEKIARENHDGDYHSTIHEIELKTDKASLLEFLNKEIWRK